MKKNRFVIKVIDQESGNEQVLSGEGIILVVIDSEDEAEYLVDAKSAHIQSALNEIQTGYHEQIERSFERQLH